MPLTDARDNFSRLVADVESMADGLYVLTKGGKPAIALISIKYLEEMMDNKELSAVGSKPLASGSIIHDPMSLKPKNSSPAPEAPHQKPPSSISSFEPPKVTDSAPQVNTAAQSSSADYDVVKPEPDPSWTGEATKKTPLVSAATVADQTQAPALPNSKPVAISQPPDAPMPAAKPVINPWPIIPPRMAVPPQLPSRESRPPPVTPTPQITPAPLPILGAPPPPRPPSPLPNIPSNFQAVPVPINGSKALPATSNSGLVDSKNGPALSYQSPIPSPQAPSLPPPPANSTVPPFDGSTSFNRSTDGSLGVNQPSSPSAVVTLKPAAGIPFDSPPTTIPEPGDELDSPPTPSGSVASASGVIPDTDQKAATAPAAGAVPTSQATVKDLEI